MSSAIADLGWLFWLRSIRPSNPSARWPNAGAPVTGVGADLDIRRVRVGRFPYQLAYMTEDDRIHILAVAHDRRRPGYWHRRTEL